MAILMLIEDFRRLVSLFDDLALGPFDSRDVGLSDRDLLLGICNGIYLPWTFHAPQ